MVQISQNLVTFPASAIRSFVSIFCQSLDNGRIASNREKQFYTNNMALRTNGL